MARYSKKAQEKIEEVMHEFKEGTLKSGGNGKNGKVKSRKQAIAIGISEAKEAGLKVPAQKTAK
jgi:PHP family Zn ribbon phosphoesterase